MADSEPCMRTAPILETTLKKIDVSGFTNPLVRIHHKNIGSQNGFHITSLGKSNTFGEMAKARNASQKNPQPGRIADQLYGDGFYPHNIGVSVALQTTINDKRYHANGGKYHIFVFQDRWHTLGDRVYKLVSGFLDGSMRTATETFETTMVKAACAELVEKVLPSGRTEQMKEQYGDRSRQEILEHKFAGKLAGIALDKRPYAQTLSYSDEAQCVFTDCAPSPAVLANPAKHY